MWRFKEIFLAAISLVLVGCGGGASSSTDTQDKIIQTTNTASDINSNGKVGYYLDSQVKGVTFECGKFIGKTQSDGAFLFEDGKDCKLKLSNVLIKTIPSNKLFSGVTILEDNVNVARVLQTMDLDNNPNNGIDIEEGALSCVKDKLPTTDEELSQLVECLNSSNIPNFIKRNSAVTLEEAKEHLEHTRASLIPVAKDITVTTDENSAVDINILAENPRYDMLRYKIIRAPKYGKLSGKAPNLVYTPNSSFNGIDSFSYIAINSKFSSNIATVTINVGNSAGDIEISGDDALIVYKTSKVSADKDLKTKDVAQITRDVYRKFKDDFDFIFIVSNSNRTNYTYSGLYFGVKNDTPNLGADEFDYTSYYGSNGKLQGVIHFPSIKKLEVGPKLHELLHRWANSIIDVTINGQKTRHWGYNGFDKRGQLGGFEIDTLNIESGSLEDGGEFSAELFGSNANGGDSIPYNSIELYLMGLISADEVGDIMLTQNASFDKIENNRVYFKASKIERVSFVDYLKRVNLPQRAKNTKSSYKVLTVLLTNSTPSTQEIEKVKTIMQEFGKNGPDSNSKIYNLYEATNGKLHLELSNLSDSLK